LLDQRQELLRQGHFTGEHRERIDTSAIGTNDANKISSSYVDEDGDRGRNQDDIAIGVSLDEGGLISREDNVAKSHAAVSYHQMISKVENTTGSDRAAFYAHSSAAGVLMLEEEEGHRDEKYHDKAGHVRPAGPRSHETHEAVLLGEVMIFTTMRVLAHPHMEVEKASCFREFLSESRSFALQFFEWMTA
jgi:hypothetical protein